jgi:hypothetical protein
LSARGRRFILYQIELRIYCCKARYQRWLRQTAHDQEVVVSNPGTVYWMGVSDDANKLFHLKK